MAAIGCLGRRELLLCPQAGRDRGPVSVVGKLICPRTCWDAPSWKPLGSLAVARMFLLLPIPVTRWTWRQKHPRGICGSDCTQETRLGDHRSPRTQGRDAAGGLLGVGLGSRGELPPSSL